MARLARDRNARHLTSKGSETVGLLLGAQLCSEPSNVFTSGKPASILPFIAMVKSGVQCRKILHTASSSPRRMPMASKSWPSESGYSAMTFCWGSTDSLPRFAVSGRIEGNERCRCREKPDNCKFAVGRKSQLRPSLRHPMGSVSAQNCPIHFATSGS